MSQTSVCYSLSLFHFLPIDPTNNIQFEETPVQTFTPPRIVKGARVYPGVKNLPAHIREHFRDRFIRFVIKQVANSKFPWANPDVESLQSTYQLVYPTFPGQLRPGDAVCHPVSSCRSAVLQNSDIIWKTITALCVLRNQIAASAVAAVQRYLPNVFRQKRLQTVEARAEFVAKLFKADDNDHPIIWREYVEGTIPNHSEIGGYKPVRNVSLCIFAF